MQAVEHALNIQLTIDQHEIAMHQFSKVQRARTKAGKAKQVPKGLDDFCNLGVCLTSFSDCVQEDCKVNLYSFAIRSLPVHLANREILPCRPRALWIGGGEEFSLNPSCHAFLFPVGHAVQEERPLGQAAGNRCVQWNVKSHLMWGVFFLKSLEGLVRVVVINKIDPQDYFGDVTKWIPWQMSSRLRLLEENTFQMQDDLVRGDSTTATATSSSLH